MDYSKYRLSLTETVRYLLIWGSILLLLAYLFYGSPAAAVFGIPVLFLIRRKETERLKKKRNERLLLQFKELILSFSNNLKAGYSAENALREAYQELLFLYAPTEPIMCELRGFFGKMQNNHTIEELFLDFGKRSGLSDIRDFSQVFAVAKRSGGNLSAIIRDTAERIADRMTENEQIALLFESKRFEQKIMNVVPIAIMLYIGLTSPGYFTPLYGNPRGIMLMSVCLLVYGAAYFWALRIMQIEI